MKNKILKKQPQIKMKDVQLIIYDFDGVMTNNKVIIDQNGEESVIVNRSDGLAISFLRKMGIKQIIISTEENQVVLKRAEKLKIPCMNGIENKLSTLKKYFKKNNIPKENIIYVGNDINDLEAMEFVAFPVAPRDAHKDIRKIAKLVTKSKGGDGVIRELLDIFMEDNL